MTAVTVAYRTGVKMNTDYYYSAHVPLVEERLTSRGLRATEVRKIVGTATGAAAPYQFITTLYFENALTYNDAMATDDGRAVLADIKNFYEGTPDIMIGEI